ncbi:hypothetical protein BN1805_02448 [Proteus vulgaris]|nr:hypothetical protein BN1805_02448 [Proteus vulgaris]
MSQKINSIEYLFIVTILSSVGLFFIGTFYYLIIRSIIGLFISGDFIFSFETLKK